VIPETGPSPPMTMQSTKPYLIRAIHEWCVDEGFTPYLSVAVDQSSRVPLEFVRDGEIVLNVGLDATHQLHLGNDEITFQARFGGKAFPVKVPIARVQAIYARENGQGMAFEVSETDTAEPPATKKPGGAPLGLAKEPVDADGGDTKPLGGRSHLTRIK
jgi:stringent starvation protein B